MLKITVMELGIYFVNCYLIHEENAKSCVCIDPGGNAGKVLKFLEQNGLTLEAILLTHGHFDHVGAVKELAEKTQCKVYLHSDDLLLPEKFTAGPLYYTHHYDEGDVLEMAGLQIRVMHTPGHTGGSVCLMVDDCIFSGDTLFCHSCGRTDLPGGDPDAIMVSLARLKALEGDYRVLPGHNRATTLAVEKEYNPFMKQV
ncbi:MAG: MBL fold metallo-hydrolase [Oscillospiraceae bacterium]|nr:MBL fold metallo-hydrolase [Oscillospiraceae bacterium]